MALEKQLCGMIMLCQMTAILSGVAMLYLAVIVIIPSKNELRMGISIYPIMCSTVLMDNINLKVNPDGTPAACDWASCREWCLSKDASMCRQLSVRPRIRGSTLTIDECGEREQDLKCSALNITLTAPFRCKKGECQDLWGMYNCTRSDLNECRYIEPAYTCPTKNISRQSIACNEEKCEKQLEGVVSCREGDCLSMNDIKDYTKCTRKCSDLRIENYNIIIFSKERIIARKCNKIIAVNSTEEIKALNGRSSWTGASDVLMLFCTYIVPNGTGYDMDDCFNATLGSAAKIREIRDYRDLLTYHVERGRTGGWLVGPEETLQVMNDTKLLINSEGCVNTLSKECTQFYKHYSHDERDGRTKDRFPCYYTKSHNNFVTAQYNPNETKLYLILACSVPAGLFIISCGFLYLCSKVVNTDEEGHLQLRSFKKDPIPANASEL